MIAAAAQLNWLHALADAALDTLLATLDLEGHVLDWSRGAEGLSGHASAQALGHPINTLLPGAADWAGWLRCAGDDGRCAVTVHTGTHRLEGSIYTLGLAPGPARFGVILRDVTERAGQQALLEQTRDELAQLNRRLLEQEKLTSRKLAQSLHDELGQTLAALRLHWEAYSTAETAQKARMDERVANLVVLANRQIRSVLAELRPPLLDELGLAAALDNEIRQLHPAEGEAVARLEASDEAQLQRWLPDVEYAAFMVAREALLNALRHASAQHITVSLAGDEHRLVLGIRDDGVGIEPGMRGSRPGRIGLVGMRERALAIGAQLRIDGSPMHGTMVTLTWDALDEPHLPG